MNYIIFYPDGFKEYYKNNELHRSDGPAIEYIDGEKHWYYHGQRHRLDGPAVEYSNGIKYWFYKGKYVECSSQKEFIKLINLIAFW